MDAMTCPKCGAELSSVIKGGITVHLCPDGHGVFLERADLGALIEAENDWHAGVTQHQTMAMPRITADMTAPPASAPKARAYLETLFG